MTPNSSDQHTKYQADSRMTGYYRPDKACNAGECYPAILSHVLTDLLFSYSNGNEAAPSSAGLAEWLGYSRSLKNEKGYFPNSLLKNSLSLLMSESIIS
jgi:hypothetical protein